MVYNRYQQVNTWQGIALLQKLDPDSRPKEDLMGAKRAKRPSNINNTSNNVVKINNYLPKKTRTVDILPRNRSQENYVLQLLDPGKNIVFGIGPAGTGKTMLACQVGVKLFLEGQIDRIVVTRPAVSADEDLGFPLEPSKKRWLPGLVQYLTCLESIFTLTKLKA